MPLRRRNPFGVSRRVGPGGGRALAAGGLLVGGAAVVNHRLRNAGEGTSAGIGGEERVYRWREGRIAYSVAGEEDAAPLVLVHSPQMGASSFEFRRNMLPLARRFRVYAPDFLGYGRSDKPRRRYTPEDFAAQVEDFVREEIGRPAHLLASSLSCALTMPAAVRSPRLFGRLVFVCPTGYAALARPSGKLGQTIEAGLISPIVGESVYHALTSRRALRFYLERALYHDPDLVTPQLVEGYYAASHREGARYAAAAFVSGRLNQDAGPYFPRLPQRILICWGQEARALPAGLIHDFLLRNPRAEPRFFREAALMPHDERPEAFNREVEEFLTRE
ncbi:MAG: alpha/beta fold hydrolase [Rubrobacteraceae bacterium]|uniref:alpha/beta fold hydrolase n=1 Tax=Rubrobacter naiadicus TaxID=1392641 RepID=UPI00235F2AEF|nr:alpha/beta fold hydrolase [Rubrobacter naiadicus]MBX6762588.1 alpha/beta fold hydrolase [Rubrobacteraceae bacterium]MCL6438294.1 alpha/beta fold hydrolase [Rubrobacteraceae bacterium]